MYEWGESLEKLSSRQGASKRGHDTEQHSNKAPGSLDQRNVDGGDLKD